MVVFFKQKTAYEMRSSDWSADVCSSDLRRLVPDPRRDRDGFGGDEPDRSADGRRHAHRAALVDVHNSRRLSAHAEKRGKSRSIRRRNDLQKSVTFPLGLALTAGIAHCGPPGEHSKPASGRASCREKE